MQSPRRANHTFLVLCFISYPLKKKNIIKIFSATRSIFFLLCTFFFFHFFASHPPPLNPTHSHPLTHLPAQLPLRCSTAHHDDYCDNAYDLLFGLIYFMPPVPNQKSKTKTAYPYDANFYSFALNMLRESQKVGSDGDLLVGILFIFCSYE